jgi:hypothetical protein
MKESRSCKEFIDRYGDSLVNCANCKHWNPIHRRCGEEERVLAEHEREFDNFKRMMEDNKDIRID